MRMIKKVYIGSSVDLAKRKKSHIDKLLNNTHANSKLQKAFNEAENKDDFKIHYVPTAPDVNIQELEQKLLDEFIPIGNLYNIAKNVDVPMLGRNHTSETIEKQRQASTGKKHSPETIAKLKELAKGRVPPRAAVENSVAARKGVSLSPEHIAQISIASKKAMQDPAAREHLRQVNLGINHTPEDIEKMRQACKGRTFTPQAREAGRLVLLTTRAANKLKKQQELSIS
jgi:group I intron endonuclease